MNPSPSFLRKLYYSPLAVFCWLNLPGLVLASEESGGGGGGGGVAWVVPYAFVILCIGLGMFIVCRGARRKERAKPEQYEKISLIDRGDGEEAVAQEKRRGVQRVQKECKEAKSALIYAIVGILCCAPFCIAGLTQGLKARKIIAGDRRMTGDGVALAAVVISSIGLVLWALSLLGWAVTMMSAGGAAP